MPNRSSKRDVNQIAHAMTQAIAAATGETGEMPATPDGKNPMAVALGRLGGLKGGRARAESLTKKQRSASARLAAKARWTAQNKRRKAG